MSGFWSGVADFITVGIGDVGNQYQEMLMADASISPSRHLPVTYETVTTETDNSPEPARLKPYGPPPNDAIPRLDIG